MLQAFLIAIALHRSLADRFALHCHLVSLFSRLWCPATIQCLVLLGDSYLRLVQYSIQDYREKLYQDILKRRKELRKAEKERAGQSNGLHRSRTRTRPSADQPRYR